MISLITLLSYIVGIHWSIVSLFVIIGGVGYLIYPGSKKEDYKAKNVEFILVSIASDHVRPSLLNNIDYHSKKFRDYKINLLIDEGCDLQEELTEYIKKFDNLEMVLVPKEFKCKAIAKGKAQEYFVRTKAKDDFWYAYYDDDNLILDDNFLYEIPYYEKEGFGLSNGLLVPRKGRSNITYIADHIRYMDDLTIFRVGNALFNIPLNGIHGELLLARGDILKKITFNRESITEDFAFSCEATKQGVKIWQSDTKISILSPNNIKDFIKQRNRWYKGIKKDVKNAPLPMKIFTGLRVYDWKYAIIGSWVLLPFWFLMHLPTPWVMFNLIGAVYFYGAYISGIIKINGVFQTFGLISLIPLYGIMETIAPHYKPKNKGFIVIEK